MRLVSVVTSTRSPRRSRSGSRQQVVDLPAHRADLDLGVDEPRGADHLLDDGALAQLELELARRGRDRDHLRREREELVEHERPVVERARQAEAVVDERELARAVAVVHPADLRQRHVALVHDHEEVLGEVVEEARRPRALGAPGEVPRVVLDAGARADLEHHLDVEVRAALEPLRLEQLPFGAQHLQPAGELLADRPDRRARATAGS
jgi:hypothetical protein